MITIILIGPKVNPYKELKETKYEQKIFNDPALIILWTLMVFQI